MGEQAFVEAKGLIDIRIDEDEEDANTDLEPSGECEDPTSVSGDRDEGQNSAENLKPVPKPRHNLADAVNIPEPEALPPVASPTVPSPPSPHPSPTHAAPTPSVPEDPACESGSSAVEEPPPPFIPPPPPLPFPLKLFARKPRTKAFHWEEVNPEKVTLSLVT